MKRRKAFAVDQQVEKILLQCTRPIGAYQIAERLPKVATTQVYRALERLIAKDRARRINARNRFVAISADTDLIAICSKCDEFQLLECPDFVSGLANLCDSRAFRIREICLEMAGTCRNCHNGE
ncbi:hypothetical protein [Sphingorhabdus sp. 109]|uniref:hypothetical protein n=1 Tax=Sphingorhabdus sp. 109 TaxID=2653173 RepID=UPI001359E4C7|nr:hypothetical protein [Sphingorhabdus sp. 109]